MASPNNVNSHLILDDVLGAVGNTPLIRLDRIAKEYGLKCNLLGKAEFFSAGGSVKDRIAKRMVEQAEKDGVLIPGKSVVIEPTSGNTGIGLALVCALKGYPLVITLPEKMSLEKEVTLRALGAEIVRTPTEAPSLSDESNIGVARKLQRLIPNGVILDQYRNPNNPLAHELTTGPEIIEAVTSTPSTPERPSSGKVDAFIAGAGTGGTLTGVSRALKKTHNKDCVVVAIDPQGSLLALPEPLNILKDGQSPNYQIEGIGYDFIPDALDRDWVDVWVKTKDDEAFEKVLELMRKEALLIGGSCGSVMAGALRYLKSGEGWEKFGSVSGKNVVIILPDGLRNYMSRPWFLDSIRSPKPTPLAEQIAKALDKDKSVTRL
ncbi:hypothetical protein BOTBODRAFT_116021 [Botryobasidium botryosum FD-172 SS1]|uniref:cystathionine beta-synthase n=1 Tax=Botryobasidium botryosum (strain FD-172 SS1) TaxID=930990 RepID=A0A067M6H4_BOTB1|nr:hypothetical protein BOTBODRAFT_116021 [Botryobasidium botryosum FD-172 SS1]